MYVPAAVRQCSIARSHEVAETFVTKPISLKRLGS